MFKFVPISCRLSWPPCVCPDRVRSNPLAAASGNTSGVCASSRLNEWRSIRSRYALQIWLLRLIIDTYQVQPSIAEPQQRGFVPQKMNVQLAPACVSVAFHFRIMFMISHAAPNPRSRTQARQLDKAAVQRVIFRRNEVAGHKGHIRPQTIAEPPRVPGR